jgi:hypothetical protein
VGICVTEPPLTFYWPFALFDWRAQAGDSMGDVFAWPMICAFAGAVMGAATAVRMLLYSDGLDGADYAAPIRTWLDETPSSWRELAVAGGAGLSVMLLFWATACWIVAGYFDFAPRFGQPLIAFGPVRLYWPFAFFGWQEALAQDNPSIFAFANLFMLGGVGAGLYMALQLSAGAPLLPSSPRGRHIVHGGWAEARDIKRAGLLGRTTGMVLGVLRGAIGQRPITYNGPGHALILGATRTGQGPRRRRADAALAWEGSIVALDPKGELADGDARLGFPGTAGYRASWLPHRPLCADAAGQRQVQSAAGSPPRCALRCAMCRTSSRS